MDKIINNNMNEEIRYCKCGCGEIVNRCNHTVNKRGIKKLPIIKINIGEKE